MVRFVLRFAVVVFSCKVLSYSFVTLWTVAHQTSLSLQFPRYEYWSGLPFPSPGDLLDLEMEPASPASAGILFTTEPPGNPSRALLGT